MYQLSLFMQVKAKQIKGNITGNTGAELENMYVRSSCSFVLSLLCDNESMVAFCFSSISGWGPTADKS